MLLITIIYIAKIVLIRKQQKQAVIRNLTTLFQIVPMIPEITISESSNDSRNLSSSNNACDLTEQKGKSKCGRKRQPTMLSVNTDILRK